MVAVAAAAVVFAQEPTIQLPGCAEASQRGQAAVLLPVGEAAVAAVVAAKF